MLIKGQAKKIVAAEIGNLVEGVIKKADQYGMDRDETIENTAWIILEMMKEVSFKEYQLQEVQTSEKPQTRIECIQSMSVEELADVILDREEISTAIDFCKNLEQCREDVPEGACRKCLIKWLNSSEEISKKIPVEHFTENLIG